MLHTLTAVGAALDLITELLTATAILAGLNFLANAIRFTYSAGRWTGRLLWPAIHATVAAISWLNSQIDWGFALATTAAAARALLALLIAAGLQAQPLLVKLSAAIGRRYAALLVRTETAPSIDACWLLKESGLSQRAIATELGISRSAVRRRLALAAA